MPRIPLTEDRLFKPLSIKLTEAIRTNAAGETFDVLMEATGVFQNYLQENTNRRVYPKPLWEAILREDSPFMARLRGRQVYGVVEHPGDSTTRGREISHVITEARFATDEEIANSNGELVEGDILGTYQVVDTAAGRDLAGLLRGKVGIGISSRGDGNVKKTGNSYLVEEFELDTWDVVANPSVKRARPKQITESELTESVQGNPEFQKLSTAVSHARKTGNQDALSQAKAELQDWCLVNRVDMASDPYVLDALSESEKPAEKLTETNMALFYRRKRRKKNEFHQTDDEVITEMQAYAGRFQKLEEGIESYLEDYSEEFPAAILEAVRKPAEGGRRALNESTTTTPTPMSEQIAKMRQLKGRTLQLCETSTKGLKFHAKAALLEEVTTLRSELGPLHEAASTRFEAEALNRRLFEFEEELGDEAPPADMAPPAPDGGAAADAPIDAPLPAPVLTAIQDAADTIEQLTDPEDQEAQQLIGELRGFADSDGEDVLEDPSADFVDEIPAITESGKKARRQAVLSLKESAATKLVHKALTFSSRKMLEAHHKLKANSRRLTESVVGGHSASEWRTAATELAESYNKDMMATTLQLVEAKEPELYAANAPALRKSRNFKALKESLETIRKTFSPASAPITEAQKAAQKAKLTESAPNKDQGGKSKLTESAEVHPSVSFVNRRRK